MVRAKNLTALNYQRSSNKKRAWLFILKKGFNRSNRFLALFLLLSSCKLHDRLDASEAIYLEPDRWIALEGASKKAFHQNFVLSKGQVVYLCSNTNDFQLNWFHEDESMPIVVSQKASLFYWRLSAPLAGPYKLEIQTALHRPAVWLESSRILDQIEAHSREEAALFLEMQGDQLASEPEAFVAHYEEALKCWREQGREADMTRTALKYAQAWVRSGEHDCGARVLLSVLAQVEPKGELSASLRHDYASALLRQGLYENALAAYLQTLEERTVANPERAETLAELGFLYGFLGLYEEGITNLQAAADLYESCNIKESLATVRSNLGWQKYQFGEKIQGTVLCEKAAQMQLEGPWQVRVLLFDRLAKIYRREDRLDDAIAIYQQLLQDAEDPLWQMILRGNLAEILVDQGEFTKAIPLLNQCLSYFVLPNQAAERAHLLYSLARAQAGSSQLKDALAALEESMQLLDSQMNKVGDRILQASYLAARYDYLECYMDLLMGIGQNDPIFAERALLAADARRARLLREGLDLKKPNDKSSQEQLQTQFEVALLTTRKDFLTQTEKRQFERMERLREMQVARLAAKPQLPMQMMEWADVELLLDRETTLLYFAMGQTTTWLWVVNREGRHAFSLGERNQIEQGSEALYCWLKQREIRRYASALKESAHALSKLVLSKAAPYLRGKKLMIVADGTLLKIPFAVLPDPTQPEKMLVERFEIVMEPSLASLAAIRNRENKHRAIGGIQLFADPNYEPESKMPPLRYSRQEVQNIAAKLPNHRLLLGAQASKAHLKSQACRDAGILHFSVHGLFYPNSNDFTAILLSTRDETGQRCDGILPASEIRNMTFNAELVVLSSCETALGKPLRGEGLLGMPQSFFEAGARSLITSFWKIDDEATAVLQSYFYEYLSQNEHLPAQALRKAQLAMLQEPKWSAPYYWSGFALQGDNRGLSDAIFTAKSENKKVE